MWDVRELFPGQQNHEIAEQVATFFNKISDEFDLITELPADFCE